MYKIYTMNLDEQIEKNSFVNVFQKEIRNEFYSTEAKQNLFFNKDEHALKKQRYTHLHFDSFDRILNDIDTEYTLPFHQNIQRNYTRTFNRGGVEFVDPVQNINSIKIYAFRIPLIEEATNFYNRVFVLFKEFKAQSFELDTTKRYHFICKVGIETNSILLTPLETFDEFFFSKPFTRPQTLTLQLLTPDIIIPLPKDRLPVTYIQVANALPARFQTSENHGLRSGDIVYFVDTNVSDAVSVFYNNILTSTEGLYISKEDEKRFNISALPVAQFLDQASWDATHNAKDLLPYILMGSKRIIINIVIGWLM